MTFASSVAGPTNPYGLTKKQCEEWIALYRKLHRLKVTVARLQNVYDEDGRRGGIRKFAELALKGEPLPIRSDGSQKRDFIHVSDVVKGLIR